MSVAEVRKDLKKLNANVKRQHNVIPSSLHLNAVSLISDWTNMIRGSRATGLNEIVAYSCGCFSDSCSHHYELDATQYQYSMRARQFTTHRKECERNKSDGDFEVTDRAHQVLNAVAVAIMMLNRIITLVHKLITSGEKNQVKALRTVYRELNKNLNEIEQYIPNAKMGNKKREVLANRTYLSWVPRADVQKRFLESALENVVAINEAESVIRCSVKSSIQHGTFPEIEKLISKGSVITNGRIIRMIGRKYLP